MHLSTLPVDNRPLGCASSRKPGGYLAVRRLHRRSRWHCARWQTQLVGAGQHSEPLRPVSGSTQISARPPRGWLLQCRPRPRSQTGQKGRRCWFSPRASWLGSPRSSPCTACWSPRRSPSPEWWWWRRRPSLLSERQNHLIRRPIAGSTLGRGVPSALWVVLSTGNGFESGHSVTLNIVRKIQH